MKTSNMTLPVFLALVLAGCGDSTAERPVRMAMLPKLVGIGYFDAAETGAREAASELGIELTYDGPAEARHEDQMRMIDGWNAMGIDIIAVAPNDPDGIAATLKTAVDSGVRTITWDTDANRQSSGREYFVNQAESLAIARGMVDLMVRTRESKGLPLAGSYLIVSGTPTAANQNTWIRQMTEYLQETHPEMELLPPLTPGEDQSLAQEQTTAALNAHAELNGIWGITSVALPAAARAVTDAARTDSVCVTGVSLPSLMREYVQNGSVDSFLLWDVVDLGYLTVHVAARLHQKTLKPGRTDFGRLKNIEVRDGEVILGPPQIFDRSNIDDFSF
jgi:rhamnose transport system substrate-binding protein